MVPSDSDMRLRVSREVFDWLAQQAQPGDTPDAVLRRLAELPEREGRRRSDVFVPFKPGEVAA